MRSVARVVVDTARAGRVVAALYVPVQAVAVGSVMQAVTGVREEDRLATVPGKVEAAE